MPKTFTTALFAGSFLFLAVAAQAQVSISIGPKVGENLSNRHIAGNGNTDHRFGWVAGAQASFTWGRFALQPALLFSQKGNSYSTDVDYRNATNLPFQHRTYTSQLRLNYLTLPVNFTFAPSGTATGPQFFAGPYVSALLGGNFKTTVSGLGSETSPVYAGDRSKVVDGYYAGRLDAGLQAGLGFRCEHLVFQAEYSLGLRDIEHTYIFAGQATSYVASYNRGFQASASYLFDVKH